MRYFYLSLLALGLLPSPAAAQTEDKMNLLSLEEAIDYGVKNHTTVKNGKLGIEEAKARNWEIITTGLPRIDANLDYSYYTRELVQPGVSQAFSNGIFGGILGLLGQSYPVQVDSIVRNNQGDPKDNPFILKHNANLTATLTQLIFDGRYVIGLKATKDFMLAARLQHHQSERDVRYAITKAYYQAAALSEIIIYLRDNKNLLDKLTSDTRAIYQQGLIEELDLNRLELAQTNLESQIRNQSQLYSVAINNLKFQMGMPLKETLLLKDKLETLQQSATMLADSSDFNPAGRVEYQMLENGIRIRGYDVAQRRAGYFPSLAAFVNYGLNAQTDSMRYLFQKTRQYNPDGSVTRVRSWNPFGMVGLQLRIPIFDSGSRWASVKQAKVDQLRLQNNLEQFKEAATLQYISAVTAYNTSLAEEANARKSVDLSKKILSKTRIKFSEGVGSSFELATAQQDLVSNQMKYVQNVLTVLTNKAELDKVNGKNPLR